MNVLMIGGYNSPDDQYFDKTFCFFEKIVKEHDNVCGIYSVGNLENFKNLSTCVEFVEIGHPSSKFDFKVISKFRKVIKERNIDIIHCVSNRYLGIVNLAVTFLKKKPKIICRRGIVRDIKYLDPTEYITYLSPNLSHVIALSECINKQLTGYKRFHGKVTTIYQSIEYQDLNVSEDINLRKEYSISDTALIVGVVANYRKIKGLEVLVEAMNSVLKRDINIYLVVVGEGCEKNLKGLVKQEVLDRVLFLGPKKDPANYVKSFDLYVQPSFSEGLSFALVESILVGCCPIVSNVGGMPEIVKNNERGLTFEKGNIKDLENKIVYLIENSDERIKFSTNAKQWVEREFTMNKMVMKTYNLYEKLLTTEPNS
ncbi:MULTISPECIES: glycosyltransferase family 4 protein [unclassified Francisella]|uniref:glycosyltransferase family 4 protein n=1 Tax=unclassified Francisella TaxID=2610885 RepID=UPI002E31EDFD|nr:MULTISPECIES: glycosyltransferase family 4 protein [unclassified Francisella]MED7819561.1 glycosyltransferase family 4 protein [Francisella sp. 19S2-4]MED7830325.1 glycosyltransferase family 4 protein [Francisella sp. 19S2-10]